jgi:nucleotide-binding universal stress UspA family protein
MLLSRRATHTPLESSGKCSILRLSQIKTDKEMVERKEFMNTTLKLRKSRTTPLEFDRILVPVDFSGAAVDALGYAVPLARKMRARIVLLNVIEPVYAGAEPGMGYMPQQIETQTIAAKKLMRDIADELIPKALFEKAVLRAGSPYHEIATAARVLNAGLIVRA